MAIIEDLEREVTIDTSSLRSREIDGRVGECKDERVIGLSSYQLLALDAVNIVKAE